MTLPIIIASVPYLLVAGKVWRRAYYLNCKVFKDAAPGGIGKGGGRRHPAADFFWGGIVFGTPLALIWPITVPAWYAVRLIKHTVNTKKTPLWIQPSDPFSDPGLLARRRKRAEAKATSRDPMLDK